MLKLYTCPSSFTPALRLRPRLRLCEAAIRGDEAF